MYLKGRKFIWEDEDKGKLKKVVDEFFPKVKEFNLEPESITFQVGYWRGARAIHDWFVNNVQNGDDDCRDYYVEEEQFRELLNIINQILGKDTKNKIINELTGGFDMEKAKELLPDDNFDPNINYGEYYLENLIKTKKIIEEIFDKKILEQIDIDYCSSW